MYTVLLFKCTQKRGDELSTLGRPKSDNPKDIQLKIRADKQTIEDLQFCCKQTGLNKSDVIRLGIKKVKQEVENKKRV